MYAQTIGCIQAQLEERAPGIHVSNRFDFDATAQRFVVKFPAGPFTLLVVKSAFEAFSEEKLLVLVGEVSLAPGGQQVLTDGSE